jgi:hypothetical protein
MELPAADPSQRREIRVPVEFTTATAPPPAVESKDGPAKPAPPPPAPAPEPIHGLVLKTVDVNDRRLEWLHWIELTPLSPREYLDADIGYDQRGLQIVARFRPKILDERGYPQLPGGNPIEIKWDPSGANLAEQGRRQLEGKLDPASGILEAVLHADAPADETSRELKIAVDGYPRAFLYRVECRRNALAPALIRGDDLARERTAIRIESVAGPFGTVPGQQRIYHFPPHLPRVPPPPDEKGPKIEHIDLQRREVALFPGPANTLFVNLQADAPLDAFTNDTDGIQVKLPANNVPQVFRATRSFEAFFVGAGAGGLIEFKTQLSDLTVPINVGALQNADTVISAAIRFRDRQSDDFAQVKIDGSIPIIRSVDLPQTVVKDSKAKVTFRVADFSGVSQVLYGFAPGGALRLPEPPIPRTVQTRTDELGQHVFDVDVDTKDMPVGNHLLVAKVVDLVGRESELSSRTLTIRESQPAGPARGEIRGVIKAGRADVNGNLFDLTIEGGEIPRRPVPLTSKGTFVVPDLPPGEYTFKVNGIVGNASIKAKEFKFKPTDPQKKIEVTLDVSG